MVSLAVERNLPIFKKNIVIQHDDKFYVNGKVGSDNFLGFMNSTPRKDYFAYIDIFNDKSGVFKIGKIEYTKVNKLKLIDGDSILIEVIPNKSGGIIFPEYVPAYSSSYVKFTNEIRMSFFNWVKLKSKYE
jgi:hypothetical protein